MPDALSDAKAALAHANQTFPSRATAPAAKPVAKPAAAAPSTSQELAAKKVLVDKAVQALPKMHRGGPVLKDGAYNLKAGEHVLTAPEASRAKLHALAASGMKSLANPGTGRKGTASVTVQPMPKTSFTDKNLDPKMSPGGSSQRVSSDNAKAGGSISAMRNAPRQLTSVQGTTKVSTLSKA